KTPSQTVRFGRCAAVSKSPVPVDRASPRHASTVTSQILRLRIVASEPQKNTPPTLPGVPAVLLFVARRFTARSWGFLHRAVRTPAACCLHLVAGFPARVREGSALTSFLRRFQRASRCTVFPARDM